MSLSPNPATISVFPSRMNHLFNLLVVVLVLFNVTGLTLLALPHLRLPYGLTQGATIVALCLACFFVEHYVGLGSMSWLLPTGTVVAGWLMWTRRAALRVNVAAIVWLLVGFFYCLAWRYLYPNIDASTERMADLSFVADYSQGVRLPPPDLWCPPYTLNHYYSFQHYAAGLLGRVAGVSPGMAYHLAFCLLSGLTLSSAYEGVRLLCARRWAQALVLATFLVGGTGASCLTPFMLKDSRHEETPWASMRFVGTTTSNKTFPDEKLTAVGKWVQRLAPPADKSKPVEELPMETFSYIVELGDYHAPLGGAFLLAFSLGAAALLLRRAAEDPKATSACALLGASLPLTLATNAWTLPFQTMLAVGVLVYRRIETQRWPDLPAFFLGAAGVTVAFFPFFVYFLPLTVGNQAPMQWTTPDLRTPLPYFLIVFWPVLTVCLAHFIVARREAKFLSFFWLIALVAADAVYMNDIYGPGSERFNSTLKWWPWVFNGTLLSVAAINLDSSWRWVRITTAIVLTLVLSFTVRLSYTWFDGIQVQVPAVGREVTRIAAIFQPEPSSPPIKPPDYEPTSFGKLDGDGWLRNNTLYGKDMNRAMGSLLDFLKTQPRGVMIEKPDERAFAQVGEFSIFSGQPTLLGWVSHEELWRNNQTDLEARYARINEFYAGTLPDPLRYLAAHKVRFVLWLPRNNKLAPADAFDKMQAQVGKDFDWNEFYRLGNDIIGVWVHR